MAKANMRGDAMPAIMRIASRKGQNYVNERWRESWVARWGYFWQEAQKKVERPACTSRWTGFLQRTQGWPARS